VYGSRSGRSGDRRVARLGGARVLAEQHDVPAHRAQRLGRHEPDQQLDALHQALQHIERGA
jgi:hypothetical protein